jgi:hypothetical protein
MRSSATSNGFNPLSRNTATDYPTEHCSPDEVKRNPGAQSPDYAALHSGKSMGGRIFQTQKPPADSSFGGFAAMTSEQILRNPPFFKWGQGFATLCKRRDPQNISSLRKREAGKDFTPAPCCRRSTRRPLRLLPMGSNLQQPSTRRGRGRRADRAPREAACRRRVKLWPRSAACGAP